MHMDNYQHYDNQRFSMLARDLLISNFPSLASRIREAFRVSPSFRDLCEDYQLVVTSLSELVDKQNGSEGSTNAILHSLKLELEQEMFNYFKSFKR